MHQTRFFPLVAAIIVAAIICLTGTVSWSADEEEPAREPVPAPAKPFPELFWMIDKRIKRARKVFVSSVDPDVAFVSAIDGLWRTSNNGDEWKLVAGTSPARMGTISSVAACPGRSDLVVMGSLDKGVFISRDCGATWRPAGGVSAGLSCPKVHTVTFSMEDRGWDTIIVTHGTDGAGLSKSIDGGRTWRVLAPSRHFGEVFGLGQDFSATSATADEPDRWQLVRSETYGEVWHIADRDIAGTTGVKALLKPHPILWGRWGGKLVGSFDNGMSYETSDKGARGRWNSVFVTPGRTPEEEWYWGYDPFGSGLVCGWDFDQRWKARNRGLYVSRMIKRGANVSASASGTRFYACINGQLYVGGHVPMPDSPVIRQAKSSPASLVVHQLTANADCRHDLFDSCKAVGLNAPLDAELAKMAQAIRKLKVIEDNRRFKVQVRVDHPKGIGEIESVIVRPDMLGVHDVHLVDDGKHNDGKPGDGLFGGEFVFREKRLWNVNRLKHDRRDPFPGRRGIPVTATDKSGNTVEWTLMLNMYFSPKPHLYWNDYSRTRALDRCRGFTEGDVTAEVTTPKEIGVRRTFEVKGKTGPWRGYLAVEQGSDIDVSGLKYVTFRFRGAPGSADVSFFLVDEVNATTPWGARQPIEPKCFSNSVPLIAGRYVPVMDGRFRDVKIPVVKLVKDIRFMRRHLAGFGLHAGDGSPGGTYNIDDVRFTNE